MSGRRCAPEMWRYLPGLHNRQRLSTSDNFRHTSSEDCSQLCSATSLRPTLSSSTGIDRTTRGLPSRRRAASSEQRSQLCRRQWSDSTIPPQRPARHGSWLGTVSSTARRFCRSAVVGSCGLFLRQARLSSQSTRILGRSGCST